MDAPTTREENTVGIVSDVSRYLHLMARLGITHISLNSAKAVVLHNVGQATVHNNFGSGLLCSRSLRLVS